MLLTKEEFEAKKLELTNLARSVDIWTGVAMTKQKEETIQGLFEELEEGMYKIECDFLELKLTKYKEIYEHIKK